VVRKTTMLWVCLPNLAFAAVALRRLADERSLCRLLRTGMSWKEYSLPVLAVVVLILGIVLEAADSKLVVWVNAGFFLRIAGYAIDVLVHALKQPEARIFGWLLAIPASVVVIIGALLYWGKMRLRRASCANS
jgi:hypothetical protein